MLPLGHRRREWIPIWLSAFIVLGAERPWEVLSFSAFALLIFNGGVVALLLWWADKYEREPKATLLWAFCWGAFPAAALAILFSLTSDGSIHSAVIVEESVKFIGFLFIFRKHTVDSWTDGLVMGGFVGLGFALIEDIVYATNSDSPIQMIFVRGIFSVFAHTLFTGIGCAILAGALLSKRYWLGVIGFLSSIAMHFTWNFTIDRQILEQGTFLYFCFYSLLPPLVVLAISISLRIDERKRITRAGICATQNGEFEIERLEVLVNFKARRRFIKSLGSRVERKEFKSSLYSDVKYLLNSQSGLENFKSH